MNALNFLSNASADIIVSHLHDFLLIQEVNLLLVIIMCFLQRTDSFLANLVDLAKCFLENRRNIFANFTRKIKKALNRIDYDIFES